MLEFRLKALKIYSKKPMPTWGRDLSGSRTCWRDLLLRAPAGQHGNSWDEVPDEIKDTFEKLGIPEAEQKILAGVGAQYESEMVYHSLKQEWTAKGVIFDSIEDGLKNHPDLFRKYFATVVPPVTTSSPRMNSAVWSGGSFVYIPKGVKLETPLQAYFRVNQERMGQFERTLIIVRGGLPRPLHRGVHGAGLLHRVVPLGRHRDLRQGQRPLPLHDHPELVEQHVQPGHPAGDGARARGHMEWLDGNLGSKPP